MNRRSVLLGMGTAAAGAGAVFGSGAFTQVQAERDLTIGVDEDSSALLGLKAGSEVTSVYNDSSDDNTNDGELVVNTDKLSGDNEGFAVGSTVAIGETDTNGSVTTPAFTLTNNFDELDANTEDDSNGLDIALDLTNVDLSKSALTQLTFVGTPTSGTTQVTAAGERNVFTEVSANESIEFAIEFKTASTTNPSPLDSTITFQTGSDLTSDDFPTEDSGDPIRIADWNDLDAVRDKPAASYILANDLDSSTAGYESVVDPDGSGFTPVGTLNNRFKGEFDGDGNTISDLEVRSDGYAGLFGLTDFSEIRNLTVENATVVQKNPRESGNGIGAVAGLSQRSTVKNIDVINTNVTAEGNIGNSNQGIGSVAGTGIVANFENVEVSSTTVTVEYDENDDPNTSRAGGIVGYLSSPLPDPGTKIINSSVDADINGTADVGGLVGLVRPTNKITIKRSSVSGVVNLNDPDNAGRNFGGLIGGVGSEDSQVEIEESRFVGTVRGASRTGGLVGDADSKLNITNTFADGDYELKVDAAEEVGGGLIGNIDAPSTLENVYAAGIDDATTEDRDDFGGIAGDIGRDDGGTTIGDITITNNSVYIDTDSGVPDAFDDGSEADISGVSSPGSDAMKGSSATETMSEFDFNNIWKTQTDPADFPNLRTFN